MSSYDPQKWPERKLAAQCIFPRLSVRTYNTNKEYREKIDRLAADGIGGFCVFDGGLDDTRYILQKINMAAETPLLFCADFEYGLPMRLDTGTEFPHAMALGMSGKPEHSYKTGRSIALEARAMGIYWNLAPVCDINTNRENPIINIRSFGEDAETVSKYSSMYIKGLQFEKVLACAKHFPGHGDTTKDSHIEVPLLNHSRERIEETEIRPFISAMDVKVKSIMAGHLSVPALDDSGTPASLSHKIITGYLRDKLGYKGIIVTDALDMKALSDKYGSGDLAIKALMAGNNIALMPEDPVEAIDYVEKKAVEEKNFRKHLKESAELILKSKKWAGSMSSTVHEQKELTEMLQAHEKEALKAAFDAVRFVGDKKLLPIAENLRIAGFAFVQGDNIDKASMFFKYLAQAIDNDLDFAYVDENISMDQIDDFKTQLEDADLYIFAFFFKAMAYKGTAGIPESLLTAVDKLSGKNKTISILFGNPYLFEDGKFDTTLYTYTDSLPGIASAIMKLSGREPQN